MDISLSSFLLNTLEKLIYSHISQEIESKKSAKDRSTESVFNEVEGVIKRFMEFIKFTMSAFLDIEGVLIMSSLLLFNRL